MSPHGQLGARGARMAYVKLQTISGVAKLIDQERMKVIVGEAKSGVSLFDSRRLFSVGLNYQFH